jgi:MFS family permease
VILVMLGPLEVLVPFAVRDQVGGGEAEYAWVLTAFGIGAAIGSLVVASTRLPRRYLTVMNVIWGAGTIPLVVMGFVTQLWIMIAAAAIVGALTQAALVIWGTVLQRRVPAAYLGRISSLDFFVSLALMPVSMALAGPIGQAVGLLPVFLVAGIAPIFIAVFCILIARMHRDEIEHPLSAEDGPRDVPAAKADGQPAPN